jgi:hypothetical protein
VTELAAAGGGSSNRGRHFWDAEPIRLALTWPPVVVWAGFIFTLSATPNLRFVQSDAMDFIVRKAGHMAVFGVLAVLLWRAVSYSRQRGALAISLALTVAYAASDEFHQSFTAGRHPSPIDVGIDSVGALVALLALAAWLRFRAQRAA